LFQQSITKLKQTAKWNTDGTEQQGTREFSASKVATMRYKNSIIMPRP